MLPIETPLPLDCLIVAMLLVTPILLIVSIATVRGCRLVLGAFLVPPIILCRALILEVVPSKPLFIDIDRLVLPSLIDYLLPRLWQLMAFWGRKLMVLSLSLVYRFGAAFLTSASRTPSATTSSHTPHRRTCRCHAPYTASANHTGRGLHSNANFSPEAQH